MRFDAGPPGFMPERMEARLDLQAPPPLATLQEGRGIALHLDFDGTLVNIASGPDRIEVPKALAARLEALAHQMGGALALVSGRSTHNLCEFLGQLELHVAGSHGGHVIAPDGSELRAPDPFPEKVDREIHAFAQSHDLLHERKAHGAALHFRAKPELAAATRKFADQLAAENGLELKAGKCVVELVTPGANKGGAVELLMMNAPFAGRTPVFIGDDVTDEDGFAACNRLGGFGIQVGERAPTVARYRFNAVEDVFAWLDL